MLLLILTTVFNSCKKEGGYGNYIISVSNYRTTQYHVKARIDGEEQGAFFIEPQYSVSWSVTSPCADLVQTAGMTNVKIMTYVPAGTHTFELIDVYTNQVLYTVGFEIEGNQCIHQPLLMN